MPYTFEELAERERRRWLRPAAHLFVRPDARGSVDCDAARLRERLLHPDHKLWNFHVQTDAQRRFPGEHAVAEGGHGLAANLPRLQARHDSLRLAFMELQHERRRKRELERAQAERLKRRYDAAWDKFIAAFNRRWDTCCKASFDPNQPRVPAGNPDGGQWRSGGGDAGAGVGVVGCGTDN